jgi:hypothetical protein
MRGNLVNPNWKMSSFNKHLGHGIEEMTMADIIVQTNGVH